MEFEPSPDVTLKDVMLFIASGIQHYSESSTEKENEVVVALFAVFAYCAGHDSVKAINKFTEKLN